MSNFFRSLKPSSDFEMVPGAVLRDLDVLTIGVYGKLLTLTEEWETSIKGLAKTFEISEDKARKCINTLEDAGFVRRVPKRSDDGKTLNGYDYIVLGIQAEAEDRTKPGTSLSQNQPCLISAMPENGQGNNIQTYNNTHTSNNIQSIIYSETATPSVPETTPKKRAKPIGNIENESYSAAAERIYTAYPGSVIGPEGNRRSLKSRASDITKIIRLLKSGAYTEEKLLSIMQRYLGDQTPAYYQKLSKFLNNIPDYDDTEAMDISQSSAPFPEKKYSKYQ